MNPNTAKALRLIAHAIEGLVTSEAGAAMAPTLLKEAAAVLEMEA
jgi:hypothetical protein